MALAPAWHMSRELSGPQQALPILKVLYRNTNRISEHGGRRGEVLHHVEPLAMSPGENGAEALRMAVDANDLDRAERTFATIAKKNPRESFDELLYTVQEDTQVHRTVLPYRAWELLSLLGEEHAHTMLRQSVRFCIKEKKHDDPSKTLVKVLMITSCWVGCPGIELPTMPGSNHYAKRSFVLHPNKRPMPSRQPWRKGFHRS